MKRKYITVVEFEAEFDEMCMEVKQDIYENITKCCLDLAIGGSLSRVKPVKVLTIGEKLK